MPPLLSFKKTFDAFIDIGDVKLPIHVARLTKEQLEEVDDAYARLVVAPRGSAPVPAEDASIADKLAYETAELDRVRAWDKSLAAERFAFFETVITQHVTLDPDVIHDDDVSVTDGAGLLRLFHGRRDVLRDLIAAVIVENHLAPLMRKNSKSPRVSDSGSPASIPARGGDGQESTAGSVESSSTAGAVAATDGNSQPEAAAPASSGAPSGGTAVH